MKNIESEIIHSNFINHNAEGRIRHSYNNAYCLQKASSRKKKAIQLHFTRKSFPTFIQSLDLDK